MKIQKIFNNKYVRIDVSKNSKVTFYCKGLWFSFFPKTLLDKKLLCHKYAHDENALQRVKYYNNLHTPFELTDCVSIEKFRHTEKKTYFFDLYKYLRYFNKNFCFAYLFGDITHVPKEPTVVKSRPITQENANSVLMKLNTVRHFIFVEDSRTFESKKEMLVWRGKAHQEHRMRFLEKFYHHPLCDVGQIVKAKDKAEVLYKKEKLSLKEQLQYKFILAIEGNDVASNLKWAMSSNSLVMMTKPKYETWFMEGRLVADKHYVLLQDDYSDLEEKIVYFINHPQEAKEIIRHANAHVKQFKNSEREDAISFMVLEKYFRLNN